MSNYFNSPQIGTTGSYGLPAAPQNNQPKPSAEQEAPQAAPKVDPKSGDEVLTNMANAGSLNFIVSQIQTKPDFSAGLEDRIAGFMNSFEDSITSFLAEMDKEFAGNPQYANLSDSDKMKIATEMFNQAFMPDAVDQF